MLPSTEIIMSLFKRSRLSSEEAARVPHMIEAIQIIYDLSTTETAELLRYSSTSSVTEVKRQNRVPSRDRFKILCAAYMGGFLGLQALDLQRNPSVHPWPDTLMRKIRNKDQELFMQRRSIVDLQTRINELEAEVERLSQPIYYGLSDVTSTESSGSISSSGMTTVWIPSRPNELGGPEDTDPSANLDF